MRACTSQELKKEAQKRHRVLKLLQSYNVGSLELETRWFMEAGCTCNGSYDEKLYDMINQLQTPAETKIVGDVPGDACAEPASVMTLPEIFRMPQVSTTDAMYRCSRCKSTDISVVMRQVRSADEGASAFFTCNSCGHKWHSR